MARIELWNGDICDLEVDAIVNAANLSLWMSTGVGGEIKRAGGLTIVQDPNDTEWPSMPLSAMKHVQIDHTVPASQIGTLLQQVVMMPVRSAASVGEHSAVVWNAV